MNSHSCLNNAHDIDVQTIQVDEWHSCLFHTNLWKTKFAWLLWPNCDPQSLWWSDYNASIKSTNLYADSLLKWSNTNKFCVWITIWTNCASKTILNGFMKYVD